MSSITRSWVAFAAVATGLIHLALVIEAPPLLGVPLGILGAAEFGWGVVTFAREKPPVPRVALVVAIVPIVAWAALLLLAGDVVRPLGFVPLAVASVFELAIVTLLGIHLRSPEPKPAPGIGRYLVGLLAGGLVIVALAAPALAATEAGGSQVPDDLFLPTHGGH